MHASVVAAQAETLREWASSWSREAAVNGRDTATEIADALRRASALMLDEAGLPREPYDRVEARLPEPPRMDRMRDG